MLQVRMATDGPLLDFVNEIKCTDEGDRLHCIVGSGPSVWNEMEEEIDFMEGREMVTVDRVNLEGGLSEDSSMSAESQGFHVEDMNSGVCFVDEDSFGFETLECHPRL